MSTATPVGRAATALLVAGDHLDQPEFHRRYEATPTGTNAELIDGVVSMPSPVSRDHGKAQMAVAAWLSDYVENTPGVEAFDNPTVILGRLSEPQPDFALLIRPESGGQTIDDPTYIRGAPELVIEVSKTTRYLDLGPKLNGYQQAGVPEYVVRALDPDDVLWFRRADAVFQRVAPDADGLYRSAIFPGLWLDPQALLSGDTRRLRQVVEQGAATPQHAAFVARLAEKRAKT